MTTLANPRPSLFRRAAAVLAVAATAVLSACTSMGAANGSAAEPAIGLYELLGSLGVPVTYAGWHDACGEPYNDRWRGEGQRG